MQVCFHMSRGIGHPYGNHLCAAFVLPALFVRCDLYEAFGILQTEECTTVAGAGLCGWLGSDRRDLDSDRANLDANGLARDELVIRYLLG